MDIPDEASEASNHALWESCGLTPMDASELTDICLKAAAPHIAKAAQVQILRKLADELAASEIGTSGDTVERETWWMAVGALRDKADDLEQS